MKALEAKDKMCPFIQNSEPICATAVAHINCVTINCMAWQTTCEGSGFCILIDPGHVWVKGKEPKE